MEKYLFNESFAYLTRGLVPFAIKKINKFKVNKFKLKIKK